MSIYFNNEMIKKTLKGKSVILFGAGKAGLEFLNYFCKDMSICCFIDNKIDQGTLGSLNGINVYDFSYLKANKNKLMIIITSLINSVEISEQLMLNGFKRGEEFIIWNKYYDNKMDNNVLEFIQHNKKIWGNNKTTKKKNKILLRHYSWIESIFIDWSYFSNYFANKYDAEIWAFDFEYNFFDKSIEEIYQSFNVQHYLYLDENSEQKNIAKKIVDDIWPNLKTKEDWLNINIYGENFGMDILGYYIRSYPNEIIENIHTEPFKRYLWRMVSQIVFWEEYFKRDESVKVVLLGDAQYRDAIIRKIAVKNKILVYSTDQDMRYKWNNYIPGNVFFYYKKFFQSLTTEQKEIGCSWAKKKLAARLNGDINDLIQMKESAYCNYSEKSNVLKKNNKIKVMICPHCFGDNPYGYGRFLFEDHWEWLCFLGEMSLKTNYDWYLKIHPESKDLDLYFMEKLIRKYPNIHVLPKKVSPIQLQKEGMKFAFTVWGTIGHEYPAFGIQVINAGVNPHIAFDFTWNPKTKKEYEYLLLNLENAEKKIDINEIYQFYSIYYLFHQRADQSHYDVCYKNPLTISALRTLEGRIETKRFREFLEDFSDQRHEEILKNVEKCVIDLDEYADDKFIFNKHYLEDMGGEDE